ncbi:hypothetical protein [Vibrio litoralis]|uniref:hypothetical protein n=1 Tax=Vibrio litoralis TaxID=335972 RepID=UPI000417E7DA|nr:hypothetical protein [Vibrio litoralis]
MKLIGNWFKYLMPPTGGFFVPVVYGLVVSLVVTWILAVFGEPRSVWVMSLFGWTY